MVQVVVVVEVVAVEVVMVIVRAKERKDRSGKREKGGTIGAWHEKVEEMMAQARWGSLHRCVRDRHAMQVRW